MERKISSYKLVTRLEKKNILIKLFISLLNPQKIIRFNKCYVTNTVKPAVNTTCIKRPPMLRDHLQIRARVITIILTCIKRPHAFEDQRPLFASQFCNAETSFCLRVAFNVKTSFNLMVWNFIFDDGMSEINCLNCLFAFRFQNSSEAINILHA